MKIFLITAFALVAATTGFAKLGDTPSAIEARYGAPVNSIQLMGRRVRVYRFSEYAIGVVYEGNKSIAELVQPMADRKMDDHETLELIKGVSGVTSWKLISFDDPSMQIWKARGLVATRQDDRVQTKTLTVSTEAYYHSAAEYERTNVTKVATLTNAPAITNPPSRVHRITEEDLKADQQNARPKPKLDLPIPDDAAAQFRLGQRYATGDGVDKDLSKARELFVKAALQNYPGAKEELKKITE